FSNPVPVSICHLRMSLLVICPLSFVNDQYNFWRGYASDYAVVESRLRSITAQLKLCTSDQ
ncbi:MAG: hypothetical protein RM049_36410, partial [Nostoc sp. DedQUE04]|uniref:hypothetical protein n=1 Tax=Nostoc sp. DedQUE04 TaxID=3075390 RepID=UPI002AD25ABD